nr:MAG TPA: hypothetical protein [Caudoviricetes sp.]
MWHLTFTYTKKHRAWKRVFELPSTRSVRFVYKR